MIFATYRASTPSKDSRERERLENVEVAVSEETVIKIKFAIIVLPRPARIAESGDV